MVLLVECQKCKKRLSISRKKCECGFKLGKFSGKVYWVSVYVNGRGKRERIGPNKEAAEQREREILKLRTEERYIDQDPATKITLEELCNWYLNLPEVQVKRSHRRDAVSIANLCRLLGKETKLNRITAGQCESYQKLRFQKIDGRIKREEASEEDPKKDDPKEFIRPCTMNKETVCLKVMSNRAVHHGKVKHNPIGTVKNSLKTISA